MTRLQRRSNSCECGKTTKYNESYVTKTKIYETRSSVRASRRSRFSDIQKRKSVNFDKKDGKKTFENKFDVDRMQIRDKFYAVNGSAKTKHRKLSSRTEETITTDSSTSFINKTLDGLLSRKLKMDVLDSTCIPSNGNLKDISISNEVISNGLASKFEVSVVEHQVDEFQNGVHVFEPFDKNKEVNCKKEVNLKLEESLNDNFVKVTQRENFETSLTGKEDSFLQNGNTFDKSTESLCYGNNHLLPNDSSVEVTDVKVKKKKNRKTLFQSLLEAYSEINITSLNEKRSRKQPDNFSPPPQRRRLNLDTSTTEVENKQLSCMTLSGRLKKKPGRKARPKGPVLHYLDLYVKKKQQQQVNIKEGNKTSPSNERLLDEVIKDVLIKGDEKLTNDVLVSSSVESVHQIDKIPSNINSTLNKDNTVDENPPNILLTASSQDSSKEAEVLQEKTILASLLYNPKNLSHTQLHNDKPISEQPRIFEQPSLSVKKKVVKPRNALKKKLKSVNKTFDKTICKILGYRCHNGVNELLVLFKNGTSNWVEEEIEGTRYCAPLENYYSYVSQDSSAIHRLSFGVTERIKQKPVLEESDSCSDSETDSDISCDDVFPEMLQEPIEITSPIKIPVTLSECKEPMTVNSSVVIIESTVSNNEANIDKTATHKSDANVYLQCNSDYNINTCETLTSSDLNELCNCVMSSRHVKLYPYETTKEIVSKTDGEFEHIYLKRFNHRKWGENSQSCPTNLNLKTCEKLINILEDCDVSDCCSVVVISGVEDFFSSSNTFDKLIKKSASVESKTYEQDISMLRYLVQTIRNLSKPIVAVIKKTAIGLPASILSLFDMVFDEHIVNANSKNSKKKLVKQKSTSGRSPRTPTRSQQYVSTDDSTADEQDFSDSVQNFVFPRLMGLTEGNEAQIMGEQQKMEFDSFEDLLQNAYCNKTLSYQLRNSVRHMKKNSKIQLKRHGRSQSANSETCDTELTDSRSISITRQTSVNAKQDLEHLMKKVDEEKNRTQQYMVDLSSYLNSIESECKV